MKIKLTTPLTDKVLAELKAGDSVLISGTVYTARDAAHKRLVKSLKTGLPFNIKNAIIYYVGPTPAKPGQVIGSAGPTTSCRMDVYSPILIEHGLRGMMGKGSRSKEVKDAIKKYRAVYFSAVGGAGALLSKCIKKCEVIAYEDLGPEAVRKVEVENFPAIVVNDIYGNDLYNGIIKKLNNP